MTLPPGDGAKGWYVDPDTNDRLRFWTGKEWTSQTRTPERPIADYIQAETALTAPKTRHLTATEFNAANAENNMDAAETAGYVLAVFLPLIGLILGFVLVGRSSKHGIWVVLLSLFCGFVFWPLVLVLILMA